MWSEILAQIILYFLGLTYLAYVCLETKEQIDNEDNFPEKLTWKIPYTLGIFIVIFFLLPFYFSVVIAGALHNKLNEEKP